MEKSNNRKKNIYIHRTVSVETFLESIKNNPYSIFTDYEIRYALEFLRLICRTSQSESKITLAKETLRKAGLRAFIPEETKRRSKVGNLKKYENSPEVLVNSVNKVKDVLSKHLKKRYGISKKADKGKDIANAYLELSGSTLMEGDLKYLTKGERDKDKIALSIGILSLHLDITYDALRKFYYDNKKKKAPKPGIKITNLIKKSNENKDYYQYVLDNNLIIKNPLIETYEPKPVFPTS